MKRQKIAIALCSVLTAPISLFGGTVPVPTPKVVANTDTKICYTRTYTDAELAKNKGQFVKSIGFESFRYNGEKSRVYGALKIEFTGDSKVYSASGSYQEEKTITLSSSGLSVKQVSIAHDEEFDYPSDLDCNASFKVYAANNDASEVYVAPTYDEESGSYLYNSYFCTYGDFVDEGTSFLRVDLGAATNKKHRLFKLKKTECKE